CRVAARVQSIRWRGWRRWVSVAFPNGRLTATNKLIPLEERMADAAATFPSSSSAGAGLGGGEHPGEEQSLGQARDAPHDPPDKAIDGGPGPGSMNGLLDVAQDEVKSAEAEVEAGATGGEAKAEGSAEAEGGAGAARYDISHSGSDSDSDGIDFGGGGEVGSQGLVEGSFDENGSGNTMLTDQYGFFVTSERIGCKVPEKTSEFRRKKEESRVAKWESMRANWSRTQTRDSVRLKRRVRKGIPDQLRADTWQLLSGSRAMLEANPGRYQELVNSDVKVEGPIEEDLPRTMYDHRKFSKHSRLKGKSLLRNVLNAYGRYDRQVQYCQGMNYISALFLVYMGEEEAFWMLVAVMNREKSPLRELFLPGMHKTQEFLYVLDSLVAKFLPRLCRHIISFGIRPNMYAYPWFVTCFTQRFPYDLVTRAWDAFLLEDYKVMYRICLALLKYAE
ncbi:unnamed protein product, partial [Chrysoparadoxa australica]